MLETQPDQRPTVQQILETEIIQNYIGKNMLKAQPDHEELREIYEKFQKEKKERILATPLKFDPITKQMVSTFEKVSESEELIKLVDTEDFTHDEFGEPKKIVKKKGFLEEQREMFKKKFNQNKPSFRVKDKAKIQMKKNHKVDVEEIKQKKKFEKEKEKIKKQKSAYTRMFIKKQINNKSKSKDKKIETGMFYAEDELKEYNLAKARERKLQKNRAKKKPVKPAKPWVGVMEDEDEILKQKEEEENKKKM